MSRPKSLLKDELDELELAIAEILSSTCGTPGCLPVFHKDVADAILLVVKKKGYDLIKKEGD